MHNHIFQSNPVQSLFQSPLHGVHTPDCKSTTWRATEYSTCSTETAARDMLWVIISSIRFFARQRLALRGDGSDSSANLIQLLRLRAEDRPEIVEWLDKECP